MKNLELAEDVLTRLEADRDSVEMSVWVMLNARRRSGGCGTVACIAGHILLTAGYTVLHQEGGDVFRTPDGLRVVGTSQIPYEAEEVIGFTNAELYDRPEDSEDYGDLFLMTDEDDAITRFRHLVESERARRAVTS